MAIYTLVTIIYTANMLSSEASRILIVVGGKSRAKLQSEYINDTVVHTHTKDSLPK